MILKLDHIPQGAREPLLLALRLQALATVTKFSEEKQMRWLGPLAEKYTEVIDKLFMTGDIDGETQNNRRELKGGVAELKDAAAFLWDRGLQVLQRELLDGWDPPELDLELKLDKDLLLNFQPDMTDRAIAAMKARRGAR